MNNSTTIGSRAIAEQLNVFEIHHYNPNELATVIAVVGPLLPGPAVLNISLSEDSSRLTMLASEAVLARDWNTPEEDEAWAHL